MKDVFVNVYEEKPIYKLSDLDEPNRDYRIKKGYKLSFQQNIFGEKHYYLLNLNKFTSETAEHFFLVHNIADYLKQYFKSVRLYDAVKPDIIFQFKNRKIAVEIETGRNLRNSKKQFLRKIDLLEENYGDNWFFVVTNRNLVKKYRKYGKTFTRKNFIERLGRYVGFQVYY